MQINIADYEGWISLEKTSCFASDATSGRFPPVHPIGSWHVTVVALYSHGWHVAVRLHLLRLRPSTLSPFLSPLLFRVSERNRQGEVALFNILIEEKRVCTWAEDREGGKGGMRLAHVRPIVPFWLISARIDWHERGWRSTKETRGRARAREERQKEKKMATAGNENRRTMPPKSRGERASLSSPPLSRGRSSWSTRARSSLRSIRALRSNRWWRMHEKGATLLYGRILVGENFQR